MTSPFETESMMPAYHDAWVRGSKFSDRLFGVPNLDLTVEEQKYLNDLNRIFARGN